MIAIGIEQKVANLELKLAEALERLTQLELRQSVIAAEPYPTDERQLLPLDSPEMLCALQLAEECFPGSRTEVEVEFDPAEPLWKWYSLIIHWTGEVRDSVERQFAWHDKMRQAFPNIGDEIRPFVDLQ